MAVMSAAYLQMTVNKQTNRYLPPTPPMPTKIDAGKCKQLLNLHSHSLWVLFFNFSVYLKLYNSKTLGEK